jgi:hypothetical protein
MAPTSPTTSSPTVDYVFQHTDTVSFIFSQELGSRRRLGVLTPSQENTILGILATASGVSTSNVVIIESAYEPYGVDVALVVEFGYVGLTPTELDTVEALEGTTGFQSDLNTLVLAAPDISVNYLSALTYPFVCDLSLLCFDDHDGDGIPDYIEGLILDTDGDRVLDYLDDDDDGDSLLTSAEHGGDGFNPAVASSGAFFHLSADDDGDGVLTIIEVNGDPNSPTDGSGATDTDGDGIPDYLDSDDDGDGILTSVETGGLPTDGYLSHIAGSCGTGGTEVAVGLCAAAPEVL